MALSLPLPRMDHGARRDRVRLLLDEAGCDALLVTAPADVRYLTGFAGSNGALLVADDAVRDVFVTDARYRERVRDIDVAIVEIERRLGQVIAAVAPERLGIDAEHVTLAVAERLELALGGGRLVRTAGLIAGLRARKDAGEVARITLACAITDASMATLGDGRLRAGRTELEVARAFEGELLGQGADGIAFPTIVASGGNGASPHHEAGERVLRDGDLVTIDGGAQVDGYCADMTRTLPVGRVGGQLAAVHAVVVAANAAGRAAAQVDGEVGAVDDAARAVIVEAGLGPAFVHPTGHGIGLAVHEAPLVVGGSAASLAVGTTFTVEPGIYLPGVGGVRIEDSLVVRNDVVDVLTVMDRRLDGA
jgi:Xaa-Pro dipeptidase